MCDVQTLFSNYSMDVHYRVFAHSVWHATLINIIFSNTHASVCGHSLYAYFTVTPSQGSANRVATSAF